MFKEPKMHRNAQEGYSTRPSVHRHGKQGFWAQMPDRGTVSDVLFTQTGENLQVRRSR